MRSLVVLSVIALAGCSHDAIPKTAANPVPAHDVGPPAAQAKTDDAAEHQIQAVSQMLGLDAEIVRQCKLHFDVAPTEEGAPRFDTDEDVLTQQDTDVLTQVATCLTTGPLAGRHLKLVGRADSRGTTEYNFVLGGKRAATVTGFLENKGVTSGRITETSRGELDATGTDDVSMRSDRRVDIVLGS